MTAVEELQAAIDKLTRQLAAGDALEWAVSSWHDGTAIPKPWADFDKGLSMEKPRGFNAVQSSKENVALFVTLHRTIDAQLAILQHVAAHYRGDLGIGTNRHVVALARAILAVSS